MAKAKEIMSLDCEAGAASAAVLVLRARLEEMSELRAAALDWSDVEGVHDMRVASRRLRSALRDFMPYLRRKRGLRRSRKYLKTIACALGAVRDQDVAILALEELKREAPEEVAAGLEHLARERASEREQARAALVEVISEDALARLQAEFTSALEQAAQSKAQGGRPKGEGVTIAGLSFRHAGREIITASFHDLQRLSASLYQPFNTDPLHRMRIVAKRLRYAIELFVQCWGESLTALAEEIAEMQSHLGELHDCDIWIAALGARLRAPQIETTPTEGEPERERDEEKRRAAVWLLSSFVKARTKHYRAALERWHEWEKKNFAANLMASLDAQPKSIELTPVTLPAAESVASD